MSEVVIATLKISDKTPNGFIHLDGVKVYYDKSRLLVYTDFISEEFLKEVGIDIIENIKK